MGKKIEGKKIAEEIASRLKKDFSDLGREVKLGVLVMEPDFATEKFITIKRKTAEATGVALILRQVSPIASTEEVVEAVRNFASECDGLIVQLPLAPHVDAEKVIAAIPADKDVDGITPGALRSPVVEAMREVLYREEKNLSGMKVVVIGQGALVGAPAAFWVRKEAGHLHVLSESISSFDKKKILEADVIILGAGSPGLLTPAMIKEGVIILDAGTSEAGGKLAGDADPACAEKASLFTPVPGGIGPIAVVMIFQNLLTLVRGQGA